MIKKLLFVSILLPLSIQAQESCRYELDIATAHVPPIVSTKLKLSGAAVNGITQHFKHKVNYAITIYPWARALEKVKGGAIDAIFPVLKSKERSEYLNFVEPAITNVDISLYKRRGSQPPSLEQHSVIATLRAFETSSELLGNATIKQVNTFAQAIKMLANDRVDYIYGVKEIIDFYLLQQGESRVEHVKAVETRPVYLALSKASGNFLHFKHCLSQ